MKADAGRSPKGEPPTTVYLQVYQKISIYYECAINEEERKNKRILRKNKSINELKQVQEELIDFFDENINLFANPFHFLQYEEEDVNKNDLRNYITDNCSYLLTYMEDIIKCSVILNRNAMHVCNLFNEVYKQIQNECIKSELKKSEFICEVFKACIEKENLILMIFFTILNYLNKNEKIGVTTKYGHTRSSKNEYFSEEKEENFTDMEGRKRGQGHADQDDSDDGEESERDADEEDLKTSSGVTSSSNNSISSVRIPRRISRQFNSSNRINADRFSLYILTQLTENDFVENILSEVERILKFLIKYDDICMKMDYVFSYKAHKINVLFNLVDVLFLYFSKFQATSTHVTTLFKLINHVVSAKYFDFVTTDHYVKELDSSLFVHARKKRKRFFKYLRTVRNSKFVSQMEEYYRLDMPVEAVGQIGPVEAIPLGSQQTGVTPHNSNNGAGPILGNIPSGAEQKPFGGIPLSGGNPTQGNVPSILINGQEKGKEESAKGANTAGSALSNTPGTTPQNCASGFLGVLPPPNVSRDGKNKFYEQQSDKLRNNHYLNRCLDCQGYWYNCNCSLNDFDMSSLTLTTQISLLLILCLHPNVEKYVYEKRKNITVEDTSPSKGDVTYLLERKKEKINFQSFYYPDTWKYNCMSSNKELKHLNSLKNTYSVSSSFIKENVSHYYSFFVKINEEEKRKRKNTKSADRMVGSGQISTEQTPQGDAFWKGGNASNEGEESMEVDPNVIILRFVVSLFTHNKEEIFWAIFEGNFFRVFYDVVLKKISSATLVGTLMFHLFHMLFSYSFIKNSRTTDLWNSFMDFHIKKDFQIRWTKRSGGEASSLERGIPHVGIPDPPVDLLPGEVNHTEEALLLVDASDFYKSRMANSTPSRGTTPQYGSNNIIHIYKRKGEYLIDVLTFLKILCNNYPRLVKKYVCILKSIINRYHSRIMEFSQMDEAVFHHNVDQTNEYATRKGSNDVDILYHGKENNLTSINEERRIIIMRYKNLKIIAEEKMRICLDFYSDVFVNVLDFASVLCNNLYDLKVIEHVVLCFKTPLTANLNIFNLTKKLYSQFVCTLSGKYNEFSKITNQQHMYGRTKNNDRGSNVLHFLDDKNLMVGNKFTEKDSYRSVLNGRIFSTPSGDDPNGGTGGATTFNATRSSYTHGEGNTSLISSNNSCYVTYLHYFKILLIEKLYEQNNALKGILKNHQILDYVQNNNVYLNNLIKENALVEKHLIERGVFKYDRAKYEAFCKKLSLQRDHHAGCVREASRLLQDITLGTEKLRPFAGCKLVQGAATSNMTNTTNAANTVTANVATANAVSANVETPLLAKILEQENCIDYLLEENKLTENLLRENNFLKSEFNRHNVAEALFQNKLDEAQLEGLKTITQNEYDVKQILEYEEKIKSISKNNDGSYNNKEAIKIFFEENKNAIDFFLDSKHKLSLFKDDDITSTNEDLMNRAKVILKNELQSERKGTNIDARYLLANIFEQNVYPYNCLKMLEKCLLFLSSVNNNKLCYYLPINKNLLIDYILLEQYDGGAGSGVASNTLSVENLKAELKKGTQYHLEHENNLFKIKNRKYNNLISLVDTENLINTTNFKNVFIHNLNLQNKVSEAKDKSTKQYRTMHLLDILYEIIKTKYNSQIDVINLKCLCIEILCSSFVKNSSSALSVLCTLTDVFPELLFEATKRYNEQNDRVRKHFEQVDRLVSLGHLKSSTLDALASNFSFPYFNLKIIITFMKCVNFLLYMIGIKRKFNLSLTRVWHFFNNIDKIDEIDRKIRRRQEQQRQGEAAEGGRNVGNDPTKKGYYSDHLEDAYRNGKKPPKGKNYIFFDIFYNFDRFFDELCTEDEQSQGDYSGREDADQYDQESPHGGAGTSKRKKKHSTNVTLNGDHQNGASNNAAGVDGADGAHAGKGGWSMAGRNDNTDPQNDDNDDVYENCLKKKLMIDDCEKNVCKHLILLTNYVVQNIFYNLINNFVLKKIRDKKYENEDQLDENVKLEFFMNRQENSLFRRRYNYYVQKSKNIEAQINKLQNDINVNTTNILQMEQTLKQNGVPYEPYVLAQRMLNKSFAEVGNFGDSLYSPPGVTSSNLFTTSLFNQQSGTPGGSSTTLFNERNYQGMNSSPLSTGFGNAGTMGTATAASPFSFARSDNQTGVTSNLGISTTGQTTQQSGLLTTTGGTGGLFGSASNSLLNSSTGGGLFGTQRAGSLSASPSMGASSLENAKTTYESSTRWASPSVGGITTLGAATPAASFSSFMTGGTLNKGTTVGNTVGTTGGLFNTPTSALVTNSNANKPAGGSSLFGSNMTSSTGLFGPSTTTNSGTFGFNQSGAASNSGLLSNTNKLFSNQTGGTSNQMLPQGGASSGGNLFGNTQQSGGSLFGGSTSSNQNQQFMQNNVGSQFGSATSSGVNKPSLFTPVNHNSVFTNTSLVSGSNTSNSLFSTNRIGTNASTSSLLSGSANASSLSNPLVQNSGMGNFGNVAASGGGQNQNSNFASSQSTGLFSQGAGTSFSSNNPMQNQMTNQTMQSNSPFSLTNKSTAFGSGVTGTTTPSFTSTLGGTTTLSSLGGGNNLTGGGSLFGTNNALGQSNAGNFATTSGTNNSLNLFSGQTNSSLLSGQGATQRTGLFGSTNSFGGAFQPSGLGGSVQNMEQLKSLYESLKVKTNALYAEVYKHRFELKKNEYNLLKEKKIQVIKENKMRETKSKADINFKDREMYVLIVLVFMYFKLILKGPLPLNDNNRSMNRVMNERFDFSCDFRPTMYLFDQILGESNKFMSIFLNVIFLDNIMHEENRALQEMILRCKNYVDYISVCNQRKSLFLRKTGGNNLNPTSSTKSDVFSSATCQVYYDKKMQYMTCSYSKGYYTSLFLCRMKTLGLDLLKILFERDVLFIHMYTLWKNEKMLHRKIDKFHFDLNLVDATTTKSETATSASTGGKAANRTVVGSLIGGTSGTVANDAEEDGGENLTGKDISVTESLCTPMCVHNFLFKNINVNSRTTYLVLLLKNFLRTKEMDKIIIYLILQIFVRDCRTTINILKRDKESFNFLKYALRTIFIFHLNRQKFNNCYVISNRTIQMERIVNNFVDLPLLYFLRRSSNRGGSNTLVNAKRKGRLITQGGGPRSKEVLNTTNWLTYLKNQKQRNGYPVEEDQINDDDYDDDDCDDYVEGRLPGGGAPRRGKFHPGRKRRMAMNMATEQATNKGGDAYINEEEESDVEEGDYDEESISYGDTDQYEDTEDEYDRGNYSPYGGRHSQDDDSEDDADGDDLMKEDLLYMSDTMCGGGKSRGRELKRSYRTERRRLLSRRKEKEPQMDDELLTTYRRLKLKKKKQMKYMYDYLSDNDIIDTIKSKKICVFYDNKEKEEDKDNLSLYNINGEDSNENYCREDYYREIKSIDPKMVGYCSSYNFLPINNFYTEKYDFLETELVHVSDLRLYFYVKSFKRHAYFKRMLRIENAVGGVSGGASHGGGMHDAPISTPISSPHAESKANPNVQEQKGGKSPVAVGSNAAPHNTQEEAQAAANRHNSYDKTEEAKDIEKTIERELKFYDFFNRLNKLNENMLFPSNFHDSRDEQMKYFDQIKKVISGEKEIYGKTYQEENLLIPIKELLKEKKEEAAKTLSTEMKRKQILLNNELCEWIELSHLVHVDIDYNDIRGLNKNRVLNNYSKISVTKLILYFYEVLTRKFLFLNNSDSLIENCVLSLLGLSFIPAKHSEKKNVLTTVEEGMELEQQCFLSTMIDSVIVDFSSFDNVRELIHVDYRPRGEEKEEEESEVDVEEEEDGVRSYADPRCNDVNGMDSSKKRTKPTSNNERRSDYYRSNIHLSNLNNWRQYNIFEKNSYLTKSLNILYMIVKNKKIKDYVISLITNMWVNKFSVFYYLTQNVDIQKLKDTEKIIFFRISFHILNVFVPIIDHILNNIDKHVEQFMDMNFSLGGEEETPQMSNDNAATVTIEEQFKKNQHKKGRQNVNPFDSIVNENNFNEKKTLFEFLNPIFNYENANNFVTHFLHMIKCYNDSYLKHYVYHYYLFNYDFRFQSLFNFSNVEFLHYVKNDTGVQSEGGMHLSVERNVHVLYTSIINTYVNFWGVRTGGVTSTLMRRYDDPLSQADVSMEIGPEGVPSPNEENVEDVQRNNCLNGSGKNFNFEHLNEIIGNKTYLRRFLNRYYLNRSCLERGGEQVTTRSRSSKGSAARTEKRIRRRMGSRYGNRTGSLVVEAPSKQRYLEKSVYIFNSLNYLNINYKNWLVVYRTYIEKVTYLVDLILKIKNNRVNKKIYYLKNYLYIINNIQKHLRGITTIIKSSHYINFNIQITPIMFIVYLFITIFFFSHNNCFAFSYLARTNRGLKNLLKGKKESFSLCGGEDESDDDEAGNQADRNNQTDGKTNGSRAPSRNETTTTTKDQTDEAYKIEHLKYHKKLKMSNFFSKKILNREFEDNVLRLPKSGGDVDYDGGTASSSYSNTRNSLLRVRNNNVEAYMPAARGKYNGEATLPGEDQVELLQSSGMKKKIHYDVHSEYAKLILKSNEFFDDLLELFILLITKKHPILNKYTIIYIYECLYTLLNIYHYNYMHSGEENNIGQTKNMFLSLMKRIDQDVLNDFICNLFMDSYKSFITNRNFIIPVYFYSNVYKFIDYNTEVFLYTNGEASSGERMFANSGVTALMNDDPFGEDTDWEEYGGRGKNLVSFHFKDHLKNKVHLNNRSLNIYEESFCCNFFYNRNDLNVLSINLLIFLLNKIGIHEIDIKIDEENIKKLIKGNLFLIPNGREQNHNDEKILHTCFLLSSLCDTTYVNEFVQKADLFNLFLSSNIFDHLYEYKFNYLCSSIPFLTFPTNFLDNKNIYLPRPSLIISYVTVILKIVDKKGLHLFRWIGSWIIKNIHIFVNHLIVNNYLMKSKEITHEVNNFTTYNHELVYKCLCYASTCNFAKQKGGSSGGATKRSDRRDSGEEAADAWTHPGQRHAQRDWLGDQQKDKAHSEEFINHANMGVVNLDIIYASTYYLLRLYKNYLLYIHQNYLTLKKLKIMRTKRGGKGLGCRTASAKKKRSGNEVTMMMGQGLIESDDEEGGTHESDIVEDGSGESSEDGASENDSTGEEGNHHPFGRINRRSRKHPTNAPQGEDYHNRDYDYYHEREHHTVQYGSTHQRDEHMTSRTSGGRMRMDSPPSGNYTSSVDYLFSEKNAHNQPIPYPSHVDQYTHHASNEEGEGNLQFGTSIDTLDASLDTSLKFEYNEISLNICNLIKEHNYILNYIKDLLSILSIFVVYDISLNDENELLSKNLNKSMLEKRRKNIRTHRILQNIIPKYSIKFHCINLCLDIIEYDIGLYDEYVQESKTKYCEYIKMVLKVFMNTCFYFINIIKFENFCMLKSVSLAMKKLTNIIYFLLNNLTSKEKSPEQNFMLNWLIYDRAGGAAQDQLNGPKSQSHQPYQPTNQPNEHEINTELFNADYNLFGEKKTGAATSAATAAMTGGAPSPTAENVKKFFENIEIDIHVMKKILTCVIYFTYAMLNNQKVNQINIESINLKHINRIDLKKLANSYLEKNNILNVFTFILQRSTQIYYLIYNYATAASKR
ncbi:Uncharacterized protein PCOAH_00036100 [Plasmodium coatneyi]|uniref:Uncharacterized protein n=1 Tax=Plasmodium coatneyi TaxID=208452 RepID=A0A1B1E1M2_9APIC|nr:Uncharacterized protein PCOAH_00036100 [Plasmodium coatneyi]ANQ08942.1 Uncharacterized protein PCOAH_00036100 [Plasmodium coatneyi]